MIRRVVAVVLSSLVAVGCVGPSRSAKDYELKAANTAESVVSALGTAKLALKLAQDDKAYANSLTVMFAEAEEDASATADSFDSVQPPDHASDELRDRLDALLEDATAMLGTFRIAARRGHLKAIASAEKDLIELIDKLDEFESQHGRGP
jgi:hypothetical protein